MTIDEVVRAVRARMGRGRGRKDADARAVICWLGRGFTADSWPAIADAAGYDDHTSAIAAAQRVPDRILLMDLATDIAWELGEREAQKRLEDATRGR